MPTTAVITAISRGLHLAGTLSLLGTAGFVAWVLPATATVPDLLCRRLIRLWWLSGALALLTGAAWFTFEAAAIADAGSASDVWASLPLVAGQTRYGRLLMIRLGLLLLATGLACTWPRPQSIPPSQPWGRLIAGVRIYGAILLVVAAVALQGAIGHAGATEGAIGDGLVLSESLHLFAAGLWLGGLLPLLLVLVSLPPVEAGSLCLRFSPVALGCVLILAGTGFTQGLELIGSLPVLLGTTYGRIALLKIILFLFALALAAVNRLWLTDRLTGGAADPRRHLMLSLGIETAFGLTIIIAAAFMASAIPAAHQNPVWPFSWQFSLTTINEDSDFRQQVLISAGLIGATFALVLAALFWRRLGLLALVVFTVVLIWRAPSFSLLTTQAYPTSFQTSPTGFTAASIVHGQELFAQNCVTCHGLNGQGNGPSAAKLRIKPANLTMPHVFAHSDGELFWWLTHGIDDPEGGLSMPGFAGALTDDDRWALIDYVHAHAAGVGSGQTSAFTPTMRPPGVAVACDGVDASDMPDLRNRAILITTGNDAAMRRPLSDNLPVVVLILRPEESAGERPDAGSCIAADPAAWRAYAILADLPPDKLTGTAFLVDPKGWLRMVHTPASPNAWRDQTNLQAALHEISVHPIEQTEGVSHEHHH